jgi:hypothetical protein
MPISDIYTARSGSVAIASTSITAVLTVAPPAATKRLFVVGVRVNIGVTAAAAGNSVLFQLARPALTTATGTSGASGVADDVNSPASIGQVYTTWSTAPTLGSVLWEQQLPQTTGSSWEEFPPLGYEFIVPAAAITTANWGLHMFVTASVSTSTPVFVDLVWSE